MKLCSTTNGIQKPHPTILWRNRAKVKDFQVGCWNSPITSIQSLNSTVCEKLWENLGFFPLKDGLVKYGEPSKPRCVSFCFGDLFGNALNPATWKWHEVTSVSRKRESGDKSFWSTSQSFWMMGIGLIELSYQCSQKKMPCLWRKSVGFRNI